MSDHAVSHRQASAGNCAVTSIAMITGRSVEEVAALVQAKQADAVDDEGASALALHDLASLADLSPANPVDTPEEWADLLAGGPLTVSSHSGTAGHAFVVAGIRIGEGDGMAWVHVVDPWGADEWLEFPQFVERYGVTPGNWTAFRA